MDLLVKIFHHRVYLIYGLLEFTSHVLDANRLVLRSSDPEYFFVTVINHGMFQSFFLVL